MTVSETADSMRAGLEMLLAAVHAGDPKRGILVRVGDLMREAKSLTAALSDQAVVPRPLSEWSEDMGDVLWWKFPIVEAPYVGSPLDCGQSVVVHTRSNIFTALGEAAPPIDKTHSIHVGGWPGYHTHFTPIPLPAPPPSSTAGESQSG